MYNRQNHTVRRAVTHYFSGIIFWPSGALRRPSALQRAPADMYYRSWPKNRADIPRITPEHSKPFVSYCLHVGKDNLTRFWARFRRRSAADSRERRSRRSLYWARRGALFAVRCCTFRPSHTPLHTVIRFSHACAALHHSTAAFRLRSVHEPTNWW